MTEHKQNKTVLIFHLRVGYQLQEIEKQNTHTRKKTIHKQKKKQTYRPINIISLTSCVPLSQYRQEAKH